MIITMQGEWDVIVTGKSAVFPQQFVISGASSGNGVYDGREGVTAHVTGEQWSIAVQNDPGTGFQLSDTKLQFPHRVGDNYEFQILSNDAGPDKDFNDLVLTCSIPYDISDFLIYGNVKWYDRRCVFNPCRKDVVVIETAEAFRQALKNATLRDILKKYYPERVRDDVIGPLPPDPPPFKPVVIDLNNVAMQPNTQVVYQRVESAPTKSAAKGKKSEASASTADTTANYNLVRTVQATQTAQVATTIDRIAAARAVDSMVYKHCLTTPATNTTLTFEEYDRTAAELAGGPYTGTGDRRLLGDTVTDMYGNYIFRFSFNMTIPNSEDATDIATGENINVAAYPDVIVKVTGFAPYEVLYESAPHYNVPNLKRINLCLPKPKQPPSSACFNGNVIGSLGNVFIGGNQNTLASEDPAALQRWGNGNNLEETGIISVGSSLAGFKIDCAPWYGIIDFKGCMYDFAKTPAQNNIQWYTIRIKRAGTDTWQFVSENYKHPQFHNRNLENYIGDDVGPFTRSLKVDGGDAQDVPAYINIQRQIYVDGIDWEFSNFDRYMQLHTYLYDKISGVRTPGTFYVRVDCYDGAGNRVPSGTDMIALYIHNNPMNVLLSAPQFTDPAVINSGCGLYRLTDAQLNTPIAFEFKADDPEGFVDYYDLSMRRCPAPMIDLTINQPTPGGTPAGETDTTPEHRTTLFYGKSPSEPHSCSGYTGTIVDFGGSDLVPVELQPALSEGGWIRSGEYFTTLSFYLIAYKRQTNGYNTGRSDEFDAWTQIHMERITP